MITDEQTARDLELFTAQHGGPSVFDILDLTSTGLGSRALRARLDRPISDPNRIEEIHEGVRFLRALGASFRAEARVVEAVDRYVRSSYRVARFRNPVARRLEALWVTMRYRSFLTFARAGTEATEGLLAWLAPLVLRLGEAPPPPVIAEIQEPLAALLDRVGASQRTGRRSRFRLVERDRWLRGKNRAALLEILDLVGELDAWFAMARAVDSLGLTLPEVVRSPTFELAAEGVHHLFLDAAVPNPASVAGGQTVVFLTGPNMAGKTTYLKAVGIAMHLAHCGMGVPAASMRFTPVDALITSLRPEDNLREGLSFFLAEVRRVRRVAACVASGRRAFAVFDEIFRGTNVKDALEASRRVILGLARTRSSGFLISSHLLELADELEGHPSVRFAYFDGHIEGGVAAYSFRLREGVCRKRFGLQLLEQEQVPALLDSIPFEAR